MDLDVYRTLVAPWQGSDGTFSKRIELETSIGRRTHDISFSFEKGVDNTKVLLAIAFNFNLAPPNDLNGQWVGIVLRSGSIRGPDGVFQVHEKEGAVLVCADPPQIHNFVNSFLTDHDWLAEVTGPNGIILTFPIPRDDAFAEVSLTNFKQAGLINAQD